jgi:hypothetical protein
MAHERKPRDAKVRMENVCHVARPVRNTARFDVLRAQDETCERPGVNPCELLKDREGGEYPETIAYLSITATSTRGWRRRKSWDAHPQASEAAR